MATHNLALLLSLACLIAPAMAREAPNKHDHLTLPERLAAGSAGGLGDCWSALLELKSCTNEIVLFLLNGESYLGQGCCRAIRVITRQCWPSMLSSVGFTAEEGDILRGYCDATIAAAPPAPETPSSPRPPVALAPSPLGPAPAAATAFMADELVA